MILIGAQAIYLRTGSAAFALAEATKDADLAIDARTLGEDPLLEEAMTAAGFILNPVSKQPGAWMSPTRAAAAPPVPPVQPTRAPDWCERDGRARLW